MSPRRLSPQQRVSETVSTTPNKPAKSSKRRYILLMSAIVLVIAGWTAAWFYGRSVLADQLNLQMSNLARSGLEVSCEDLDIAGYPFRYEVSCDDLRSLDRSGTTSSLQSLRAVALIYNPWHIIFEAKAPAAMAAPLNGVAGEMTWETARASIKYSQEALGDVDAVVRKPEAAFENAFSAGKFAAEKAEFHLRKTPDQADRLDGFLSIDSLQLQSVPDLQEVIDIRGHLQVDGGTAFLAGADLVSLVQGNNGELPVKLVLFKAVLGKSSVGATGDLLVNGDGTVSGTLNLTLGNGEDLLLAIKPLFPPQDNSYALIEGVVKGLVSADGQAGETSSVALPMVIDRGAVRIGFLPLGQIPPLFAAGM